MKQQIEKFLVERAAEQLRGGALQAHVRNDALEAEISSLVSEQDARTQSQVAVADKGPAKKKYALPAAQAHTLAEKENAA
jgi:hypothetical protein